MASQGRPKINPITSNAQLHPELYLNTTNLFSFSSSYNSYYMGWNSLYEYSWTALHLWLHLKLDQYVDLIAVKEEEKEMRTKRMGMKTMNPERKLMKRTMRMMMWWSFRRLMTPKNREDAVEYDEDDEDDDEDEEVDNDEGDFAEPESTGRLTSTKGKN
ncbi:hypothetical protein FEM48_Zijuj08G0185600 [Ziziphus jujuba var. spinosa]|uniref:Uncharacterized protein n=1 Tax=Ziziphus jujuba var. spinosa TaxID=714518 RepID=A0A978V0P5_ZIZJJ|nr:hypothetical protein FEM48_Zijuj08G0185600 [Ziziphus jujuba var. spinosa]